MGDAEGTVRSAFSRLAGGVRVGADYFEREGLCCDGPAARGVVDRLEDLAHPGFSAVECARVHPRVRAFFERTADLDLEVQSRWHPLFVPVWWMLRPLMGWVGQLFLPWRSARVKTRVLAVDRARDGRADARGVVRTYEPGGAVMQVFAYATLARGAARWMSTAIPLPLGNLSGLLRLESVGAAGDGEITSVRLTTRAEGTGIWFVTRWFALRVPLAETLSFRVAGEVDAARVPGCTLVARHEQWLWGMRVAEHTYWFRDAGT